MPSTIALVAMIQNAGAVLLPVQRVTCRVITGARPPAMAEPMLEPTEVPDSRTFVGNHSARSVYATPLRGALQTEQHEDRQRDDDAPLDAHDGYHPLGMASAYDRARSRKGREARYARRDRPACLGHAPACRQLTRRSRARQRRRRPRNSRIRGH
jgi:hypothetical protein